MRGINILINDIHAVFIQFAENAGAKKRAGRSLLLLENVKVISG
jgi:hypothetical protein